MNPKRKKVIVVGGGFAGIQLVRRLNEKLFDILLIDKINHHQHPQKQRPFRNI